MSNARRRMPVVLVILTCCVFVLLIGVRRPWLSETDRSCIEIEHAFNMAEERVSLIPASGLVDPDLMSEIADRQAKLVETAEVAATRDIPSDGLRASLAELGSIDFYQEILETSPFSWELWGKTDAATSRVAQECLLAGRSISLERIPVNY